MAKKSGIRILRDIYGTAGKRRRFFAVRKSPKKIRRKHAESKKKSAEMVGLLKSGVGNSGRTAFGSCHAGRISENSISVAARRL